MKKNFIKKMVAAISSVSLLTMAIPFGSVSAEESPFKCTFDEEAGTAKIVEYTDTDATSIVIPDTIDGYEVVAVEDFAFGLCGDIKDITVPKSVTDIEQFAFMNYTQVMKFIPSSATTLREVLQAITAQTGIQFNPETIDKIMNNVLDLPMPDKDLTLGQWAIYICQNRDKLDLTAEQMAKLEKALKYFPYTITLKGYADSAAETFATDNAILFETLADYLLGDANGDGKLSIYDSAAIAKALAAGTVSELPAAADFNQDGKINIYDAAGIAKYLVANK